MPTDMLMQGKNKVGFVKKNPFKGEFKKAVKMKPGYREAVEKLDFKKLAAVKRR